MRYGHLWAVCEVVLVPYVVDVVTVMHVLLFVLNVSILLECRSEGNAGVASVLTVELHHKT